MRTLLVVLYCLQHVYYHGNELYIHVHVQECCLWFAGQLGVELEVHGMHMALQMHIR